MNAQHNVSRWYLQGSLDGVSMPVRLRIAEPRTRIGRRPDLDIVLAVPEVSALHAEIESAGGGLWIRDLGSRNGTRLNRAELASDARLEDGDVVQFGRLEFVVERARAGTGCDVPRSATVPGAT